MRLLTSLVLAVALIGCGPTSTPNSAPTDLGPTNDAIGANTSAVNDLGTKVDASSDKVVEAINALGGKLDALAPAGTAPVAKADPDTCTLPTGMTLTAFDKKTRHITGTQDAIVSGKMLVVACDVNSVQGWQAWNLSGLKLGTSANGQDGLLVDGGGNAINVDDVRGHYSSKPTTVKDHKYTVACIKGLGSDACKGKKAEKPDTVLTINGHKVTISGS